MSDEELFERLLDQLDRPYHRGRLPEPTQAVEIANPICGDQVRLEVCIADGRVSEAWFTGQGCVISQASASLLTQHVEGKSLDELRAFQEPDMLRLVGVRLTPNRQRCALLSWSALHGVLSQLPPS